jgi:hypothetical protein
MAADYTVKLVARNEGIEYRDAVDIYRFNVARSRGRWIVYLPCSKGQCFEPHELTDEERVTVLPRIAHYLETRKYFGFFGRTYSVSVERQPPVSR